MERVSGICQRRPAAGTGHVAGTAKQTYSNVVVDTRIVETGIALSKQLEPGAVPEPPKAPPFQSPWSYGNVPPEVD